MHDLQEVLSHLDENFAAYEELLKPIAPEKYNEKPAPERWSTAELIEHLLRTEEVTNAMLEADLTETESRNPKAMVELFMQAFGRSDRRYTAFGPLIPKGDVNDKTEAMTRWKSSRDKLKKILKSTDQYALVDGFTHPLAKVKMTRLEWAWFTWIHCDRHLKLVKGEL